MPMRIYPAIHYTMGGLWVDYNLMSNDPRPARARRGELLRSRRQPPRRERADAGARRRLLRHSLHARRTTSAARRSPPVTTDHDAFKEAAARRPGADRPAALGQGHRRRRASCTASSARMLWDDVGMARNEPGLRAGARRGFRSCARSSGRTSRCPGAPNNLNKNLEYAGRVADYLEFAEAARRSTRCTAPNRAAATSARRARRPTARRCATTRISRTWRRGSSRASAVQPALHKEPLDFEYVKPSPAELQVSRRMPDADRNWAIDTAACGST